MEDKNVGKKFEHDFDRADSDWIFAPGLDVQYQWNLEALGLIASMLAKAFNREYNSGVFPTPIYSKLSLLKTTYKVLCVDDRHYWTMGDPMNTI